jgi:hypothetical protein
MERPLFVETSKGYVNLARIWHITEGKVEGKVEGVVHFWLDDENDIAISADEWEKVRSTMATNGLLLIE